MKEKCGSNSIDSTFLSKINTDLQENGYHLCAKLLDIQEISNLMRNIIKAKGTFESNLGGTDVDAKEALKSLYKNSWAQIVFTKMFGK